MVWLLCYIYSNGKCCIFISLVYGIMVNVMFQVLGLKKVYFECQVILIFGDGGLVMLFGDLLMVIQEKLLIKVVVLNNVLLNFVELEQKVEGLLDNYIDLFNLDFVCFVEVIGFYGCKVMCFEEFEVVVQEFFVQFGLVLLDVYINFVELVMLLKIEFGQVVDIVFYVVKVVFSGCFKDVEMLLVNNLLK